MASKVRFNDGEGVNFADFEQLQDYLRRSIFDEVISMLAGGVDMAERNPTLGDFPGRDTEAAMRVHRRALCPRERAATMIIDFDPGTVLQHSVAGPLTPLSLVPQNLMTYQAGMTVTIPTAHATEYRRDLVEARLLDLNALGVTRDFEDAVTRAKSTVSVDKSSNVGIQLQVIQGTTDPSSAVVDAIGGEPAGTAGWYRVCSVRVDPLATSLDQATIWDWRKPWGHGAALTTPASWAADGPDSVTDPGWGATQDGTEWTQQRANQGTNVHPLHAGSPQITSVADGTGHLEDHRRISSMNLRARFQDLTGVLVSIQTDDLNAGFGTSHPDGTYVPPGTTEGTRTIYTAADFPGPGGPFTHRPLWANGMTNPLGAGNSGQFDALKVRVYGQSGAPYTNSYIRYLHTSFWGGL